jgi:formylglycine-generating enzyme required for sulfatase activity
MEGVLRILVGMLLLEIIVTGTIVLTSEGAAQKGATILSSGAQQPLEPGKIFTDCLIGCPKMVVIPAGSFLMGSPSSEPERFPNEGPQHRVTFAHPFAVGQFSVTVDEWYFCVDAGGCDDSRPPPPQVNSVEAFGRGSNPAINMALNDAKAYVAWLVRKTGKEYRLLSEAEREYVTRAGTTSPFWWGSSLTTLQANYDGTQPYNGGAPGESRKKTVPVESFAPNSWGLYQVHGNNYDLVEDCSHETYDGAPTDGSAWTNANCTEHMMRGGSWFSAGTFLRSATRQSTTDGWRSDIQGFRVARPLTP